MTLIMRTGLQPKVIQAMTEEIFVKVVTPIKAENESLKAERDELKECLQSLCSNLWFDGKILRQFNELQNMNDIFSKAKTLLNKKP